MYVKWILVGITHGELAITIQVVYIVLFNSLTYVRHVVMGYFLCK